MVKAKRARTLAAVGLIVGALSLNACQSGTTKEHALQIVRDSPFCTEPPYAVVQEGEYKLISSSGSHENWPADQIRVWRALQGAGLINVEGLDAGDNLPSRMNVTLTEKGKGIFSKREKNEWKAPCRADIMDVTNVSGRGSTQYFNITYTWRYICEPQVASLLLPIFTNNGAPDALQESTVMIFNNDHPTSTYVVTGRPLGTIFSYHMDPKQSR